MEREIDRFECADEEGYIFTVIEIQEYVSGGIPGMRRLELDDGSTVTTVDDNTFRVIPTGKLIKRIPS